MQFPLTEPTSPRYIYINPETNKVHVLMPIVSGTHIGLDNTCKSVYALQEFFGKSRDVHQRAVRDELMAYQKALEFDISLISGEDKELTTKKQARLQQINRYIAAIEVILNSQVLDTLNLTFPEYPKALKKMMEQKGSNVYSIVLRPAEKDNFLRFVNPVFSVKRDECSVFHRVLEDAYKEITELPGVRERFYKSVLALLEGQEADFEQIRVTLAEHIKNKLKIAVNFNRSSIKNPETKGYDLITKDYIEAILGCDEKNPATARDYIDALLNTCSPQLFEGLTESPFYTRQNGKELSIITQFFFGIINFYCRTNAISTADFGEVLENIDELSKTIAACVLSITKNESVEDALLALVNENAESFGLARPLTLADGAEIKVRFHKNYSEIKDAPHFDEFILLDDSKKAPFVSHQGSICCNLAEFIHAALPKLDFKDVSNDFNALNSEIAPSNPHVHAMIELSLDRLLATIKNEEQLNAILKKLPKEQHPDILASPEVKRLQLPKLLLHVARGEHDAAQKVLAANTEAQLLLQAGEFTDYSGRTFNCTAYEYAYWAKDTHMCRMLEKYMDEETKAEILKRCRAMARNGLNYIQQGGAKNSKHFDFTPLIEALQTYIDGVDESDNLKELWLGVGKAQRDVPAHVAQEYCRRDCCFDRRFEFNELSLPRVLTFYNRETGREEAWFPLGDSLGVDFALYRGKYSGCGGVSWRGWLGLGGLRCLVPAAATDLEAISSLDKVRTDDMMQSLNNLKTPESYHYVTYAIDNCQ